jgi:FtsZ-binding cell division protein ZapB
MANIYTEQICDDVVMLLLDRIVQLAKENQGLKESGRRIAREKSAYQSEADLLRNERADWKAQLQRALGWQLKAERYEEALKRMADNDIPDTMSHGAFAETVLREQGV